MFRPKDCLFCYPVQEKFAAFQLNCGGTFCDKHEYLGKLSFENLLGYDSPAPIELFMEKL
jgi:hypothetical protein